MNDAIDPQDWYSEDMATFGDRLSAAREAASLSRKELAQRVGIKGSTLRAWEEDLSEPRANRLSMTLRAHSICARTMKAAWLRPSGPSANI